MSIPGYVGTNKLGILRNIPDNVSADICVFVHHSGRCVIGFGLISPGLLKDFTFLGFTILSLPIDGYEILIRKAGCSLFIAEVGSLRTTCARFDAMPKRGAKITK